MTPLRFARPYASALLLASALAFVGCSTSDTVISPRQIGAPTASIAPPAQPGVVISQVYGGGGNAGATLKNDFIELFNPGTADVSVTGWSVQYASSTGTSWQVTNLTGTILAGHYYLVQESQGTGGTTALPTPDATGTIPMSATTGKVALVNSTAALSGACGVAAGGPDASPIVDFIGYGAANCSEGGHPAPTLTNTLADLRAANGATDTDDNAADFATGAPNPRNSGGTAVTPPGPAASVAVTPTPTTVPMNGTRALTAVAKDANGQVTTTTFTWTSTDPVTASVDASGVVTGHILGGSVTITATSANSTTGTASVTVTAPVSNVTVGGRATPLPIGFETQLFASGTDKSGAAISTVSWSTSNAAIVTVDQNGVISAAGNGSASITATAPDGSAGSTLITTEIPNAVATTRSGHNTEFGVPTDADPSNDIIITRKQYTISYNPQHAGPNWVSWNMDKTHLGSLDRCNCFTADTALARFGLTAHTTADYVAGGLWDRGHMEPSADQTTSDGENAYTFFLSNTLPQKHDLNAGPWELLENALRDSANANREIYTIAGGIFTNGVGLGTLNDLGQIGIPDSTWKIALIMPLNEGLADVHSPADVSVIAVNMPNVVGISGNPWQMYTTTIAKIEASTGYNFLNLLGESIQCKIEVRNCLPVPHLVSASGSTTVAAGTPFVLDVGATDADGADGPWKLVIDFGDGTTFTATSFSLPTDARPLAHTKTWTTAGTYTVTVSVTDKKGGTGVSAVQVTVTP